ncbi:uncharacterized protein PITG_00855 [Phytophthora infestans T30-4]|uniref:Uncharacterized protein n=2 Tax=Phytophthora infestans TaxID=4787 RepID=D0MRU8_PHYIT|nr:uncharacterized protein PITG_00855 [Phytophthora infestans T30-4]EEY58217.1 conserved hypothetical protein [Phytophthora infestans T30-4]KAF4045149.1 hypothetical protein GN244_ATG02533 [Phytophthora infestans]KAF4149957.1 hypothetical protein GN958_ATG00896 [Phytophthora infestans]|eukprot:XP_002909403.1 conserved hypothetical protein [Phytophthora infestans T30-4]
MLRRAIQRARLHLPAPIGHDNGGGGSSSDEEDFPLSPSVAYTSLRDDESVRDHFRKRPEDISGVHLIIAEKSSKTRKGHVAELSLDEQRRAADAWSRLQTLYGLFRELEATTDEDTEDSDTEAGENGKKQPKETRQQCRRDDGLRSLLQEVQLPPGVILRDLPTLSMTDGSDDNAMPQGFTAGMFAALGNAMYKEMLIAAEQNRISPDAFEELGNYLYAEAASVAVSATA